MGTVIVRGGETAGHDPVGETIIFDRPSDTDPLRDPGDTGV
jgi:hypothetical protein